ncbi:MAG: hypothetical protein Q9168_007412, partial [Polycauliona sp. 1 TL-2023]
MALDIAAVRVAKHGHLAHLLLLARDRASPVETTSQLLDAVRHESLPPTVFNTWLTVCQSDEAVAMSLKQDFSCLVRKYAIAEFGRKMERSSWESIWNALGGVQGIITLLSEFSVVEIKQACTLLGKRNRGLGFPHRESCLEQLLRALVPLYRNASDAKVADQRPLLQFYARLVPGCPTNFVVDLLDQADNPLRAHVSPAGIVRYHPDLLVQIIHRFGFIWPSYACLIYDLPSGKRDAANVSQAMHILLTLLDGAAKDNIAGLSPHHTIGFVAGPLLRRAIKNKVSDDTIMHVIRKTLAYVERHPGEIGWSRSHGPAFLCHLASYWSRKDAIKQSAPDIALSECLGLYGVSERNNVYGSTFELAQNLYPKIHQRHRYLLLCKVMQSFTKPGIDLNDLASDHSSTYPNWPCRLFIGMTTGEALALLKRLSNTRQDGNFLAIEGDNSIFSQPSKSNGIRTDPGLLLTYLSRGQAGAISQAEVAIKQMQSKSASSREQTDRAFFAKSAMFYAIASGSLDLYHGVITWCRRYIKDPMTARTVFGDGSVLTAEGIDLLSGMYNDKLQAPSTAADHWQVAKANHVVLELFNICCSALKEPSFNVNDWDAIKSIYGSVVQRRMHITTLLQQNQHGSETVILDQVWTNTIDTLIAVERTACKPEHERLCFNSASGPLGFGVPNLPGAESDRFSSASYIFLDRLAQARDELWRDIRSSYNPTAVCLSHPWPRGVPVQHHVPFDIANNESSGCTPYISSRVVKIVFMNKEDSISAVPSDEDTRSAIGGFVESYQTSLQIHILQVPSERARYEEIIRAWEHAMKITRGRMTEGEAVRFWRGHFQAALSSIKLDLPKDTLERQEYPLLPKFDGEEGTQEWDPAYNQPAATKSRSLPATAIDCFLNGSPSTNDVFTCFREPHAVTPSFVPSPIWSLGDARRRPGAVEEALIASALLFIDTTNNKRSRLLAKPFPSNEVPRFSSLILDSDFLIYQNLSSTQALEVLRNGLIRMPSTLLLSLATGILKSSLSDAPTDSTTATSDIGCRLLALCTKIDQPQIACDLILRTIIECPDTSAWHRQFLSKSLLSRLSATDAARLLKSFGTAIEAKLDAQGSSEVKGDKASKPAVKVTTVKYLAQLLDQSSFISPRESLDILSSLFSKSNHRDIHHAIAESMLGMLAVTAIDDTSASVDQVLQALRALVPVVGRLTERIDIKEKDWIAFAQGAKIPVIEDQDTPPLLFSLLLYHASRSNLPKSVRQNLVDEIILPAYELGRAAYKRWVKVLRSRYSSSSDPEILSSIPARPVALAAMLRTIPEMLPEVYFTEWHRYVEANLKPSADLRAAIDRLVGSMKLEDTSDATLTPETNVPSHWTQVLDPSNNIFQTFSMAELLQRPQLQSSFSLSDDLISLIQKLVLEQADILIEEFDTKRHCWSKFIAPLPLDKSRASSEEQTRWQKNCAPIIDTISMRIYQYRNYDWRKDPNRTPQFLPPTFDLDLALLETVDETDHAFIAQRIDSLLGFITYRPVSGGPYHHHLGQLKNQYLRRLSTLAQVEVACHLGTIEDVYDEEPNITHFLNVDLAHWLLRLAHQKRDGSDAVRKAFEKSEVMMLRWSRSRNEDFRMRAAVGLEN